MSRPRRIWIWTALAAIAAGLIVGVMVLNPVWRIQTRYPTAKLSFYEFDSPRTYWWTQFTDRLGIRGISSSRYVNVQIDGHEGVLDLDDFTEVTELSISNSKVVDISSYWERPGRLSCPVFHSCDFSELPSDQRRRLAPFAPNPDRPDLYPNSLWIPFESRFPPELPSEEEIGEQDAPSNGG
jgi:hypothetical protein